jgi:hypothetical protein
MFDDTRTDLAQPVAGALQFFSMNAQKKKHLVLTPQLSNMQDKELGYYRQSCQVVWILRHQGPRHMPQMHRSL